ncbi:hypothetical protein BC936DRAFT_146123 [Jimgerdemannia flammicorona]|uniref:Uncharacterized protein n=2 Tax=Jimgerdemannia flammicorona TaxID=994334 RepID=A0A433R0A8_9FUNG|nr:hypothetical protein BC936DRAFT_146123 [Jimgerdemannia flammicorona]RUS35467.1 hypothetical protein BC938DRAFT_483007 [Jimgerdemannia flammicorona]
MTLATSASLSQSQPQQNTVAVTQPTNLHHIKRDTRNWNYVIRSGLAGGIAGCMVRFGRNPLPTPLTSV